MITRIVIPQLFENMEEATIGAWLKSGGDAVQFGDALCELITEKATFELEAEADGVLRRIVACEKSVVPVGFIVAVIGDPNEPLPDVDAENAALREQKIEAPDAPVEMLHVPPSLIEPPGSTKPAAPAGGAVGGSRVRATPAARRAARERGVTIEDVAAAFPGKVISEEDVAKFQK